MSNGLRVRHEVDGSKARILDSQVIGHWSPTQLIVAPREKRNDALTTRFLVFSWRPIVGFLVNKDLANLKPKSFTITPNFEIRWLRDIHKAPIRPQQSCCGLGEDALLYFVDHRVLSANVKYTDRISYTPNLVRSRP